MRALRAALRAAGRSAELPAVPRHGASRPPFVAASLRRRALGAALDGFARNAPRLVTARVEPLTDPPEAGATLEHRDFLVVEFTVDVRSVTEHQVGVTSVWDVVRGEEAPWTAEVLVRPAVVAARWRPYRPESSVVERCVELAGRAAAVADRAAAAEAERMRGALGELAARRRERLDEFLRGTEREVEEERRSIYFHLYYFEREEQLEQRVADARTRLDRLTRDEAGLFAVTAEVVVEGAALLALPVWRTSPIPGSGFVDALTGVRRGA